MIVVKVKRAKVYRKRRKLAKAARKAG